MTQSPNAPIIFVSYASGDRSFINRLQGDLDERGKLSGLYPGHTDTVESVAWSPNGKLIASAGDDKTVQVWEASTGKSLLTYKGHTRTVESVAWSPNGKLIASAGDDKTVQVWPLSL